METAVYMYVYMLCNKYFRFVDCVVGLCTEIVIIPTTSPKRFADSEEQFCYLYIQVVYKLFKQQARS